jgi:hypothetical protein
MFPADTAYKHNNKTIQFKSIQGHNKVKNLLTTVSGRTEIVALSWSLAGILSGRRSALDSNNSEGGTFFSRLRSSHCAS